MVQSEGGDSILDGKKHVRVTNDMKDGVLIYLHCRSKNDDLGVHVIANGEFQEWSFKDNLGDTTLFWCSMDAYNVQMSFEVYSAKTDSAKCDKQCYRSLRKDGAYFYYQFQNIWKKELSWTIHEPPTMPPAF
ncbi:unnamed protein product [Sphenostylis stenocarpa]|uniref:S-protein homolog n=1 Tax=Sphenostylis stenocarpa TaxID=92480 RepID=A0AA86VYA7_9FABA|nr:unnamed protein product [Sphenostylis stenocarpa]